MLKTQALTLVGLITTHHAKLEELKATAQKVKATEEKYQYLFNNPLHLQIFRTRKPTTVR